MDNLKLAVSGLIVIGVLVAFYMMPEVSSLLRAGMIIAGLVAAAAVAYTSEPGKEAWAFATGARNEIRKVIWPTRKETIQTTLVVIVMVVILGLYIAIC